jgi:hypothetical protein
LNWNDSPYELIDPSQEDIEENRIYLGEIEGLVTGGSINVNGNSAVRRSGSLSCVVDKIKIFPNITNIDNLISINKRVSISIGLRSASEIVWFPQGIFIISNAQISHGVNNINISINIKDKMTLLNGECGGMFSRSMVHTPVYDYSHGND